MFQAKTCDKTNITMDDMSFGGRCYIHRCSTQIYQIDRTGIGFIVFGYDAF